MTTKATGVENRWLRWAVAAPLLLAAVLAPAVSAEEVPIPPSELSSEADAVTPIWLAKVRASTREVSRNEQGYWEADLGSGEVLVHIPAGPFPMGFAGEEDAEPVRQVRLGDFWIAKFPVTVAQFRRFVEATGYRTDAERGEGAWQWTGYVPGSPDPERDSWDLTMEGRWNNIFFEQGDDHPVGSVSWNDAQAYCRWLSERVNLPIVLPTEAQWEKAARGTDGRIFPWGNTPPEADHANLADRRFISKYGQARHPDAQVDDGYVETSPVDAYPKGQSPYGVFDLAGNLGEWVYDIYQRDYYGEAPDTSPAGPAREPDLDDAEVPRVNRGGSWVDRSGHDGTEGGHTILSYQRTGDEQNSADDHMGFRIAVDFEARVLASEQDRPDLDGVEIRVQEVRGNIYLMEASGDVAGNIAASVGDDGILLVDTQFAELSASISTKLAELTQGPLVYVVNTHFHDDHADGNRTFIDQVTVVASENAGRRMSSFPEVARPDVTFSRSMSLHFNGEEVRLMHFPSAHTDGDVVVHFVDSNVFHLGDLFNAGIASFPGVDLGAGGSLGGLVEAVGQVLEILPPGALLVPGHYELSDAEGLQETYEMLVETIAFVREAKAGGRTLEEIQEEGLPDRYAEWGKTGYTGADEWVANVYRAIEMGQ